MNHDSKMCQQCQNVVCKAYKGECRKYRWLKFFGQTNIYKTNGRYFRKVDTNGVRFDGMFLWQPMIKILWLYIPDKRRGRFWLDDWGFEGVK